MLVIDLIVGGMIVAAAIFGCVLGLGRALPVAGFAAGIVLGSRLPLLLGEELDSHFALVLALPATLLAGGIIAVLAERLAPPAARLVERSLLIAGFAGALLLGASAAVVAWALAPAVSQVSSVRDDVQRSEVLERFNAVLPPAGQQRQKKPPSPGLPQSAARRPKVDVRAAPARHPRRQTSRPQPREDRDQPL